MVVGAAFGGIGALKCGGFFGCEMPMAGQWPLLEVGEGEETS